MSEATTRCPSGGPLPRLVRCVRAGDWTGVALLAVSAPLVVAGAAGWLDPPWLPIGLRTLLAAAACLLAACLLELVLVFTTGTGARSVPARRRGPRRRPGTAAQRPGAARGLSRTTRRGAAADDSPNSA